MQSIKEALERITIATEILKTHGSDLTLADKKLIAMVKAGNGDSRDLFTYKKKWTRLSKDNTTDGERMQKSYFS